MESISTTLPSFKLPLTHSPTPQIHPFKTPHLPHHHHISASSTTTTTTAVAFVKPPTSVSTKPTSTHRNKLIPHARPRPHPSPVHTHRAAASGYAAALVDAGLCSGSLDAIHKDVTRLSKWLNDDGELKDMMGDPCVEEGVKGRLMKEVAEKAKLRRHVVALVKMLAAKSKSGMVAQVVEEFQRIYSELNAPLRVAG